MALRSVNLVFETQFNMLADDMPMEVVLKALDHVEASHHTVCSSDTLLYAGQTGQCSPSILSAGTVTQSTCWLWSLTLLSEVDEVPTTPAHEEEAATAGLHALGMPAKAMIIHLPTPFLHTYMHMHHSACVLLPLSATGTWCMSLR